MAKTDLRSLRSLVEGRRSDIRALASKNRGRRIAIFGSVARGEEAPSSDIDFLVEFEAGSSLFDLVRLQGDLQALLGRHVDVVSLGGLSDRDDDVRRDAIWL